MNDTDASSRLQYLADRAAIQDVLARYFQGLDRCSKDLVRSCFTEDVHVHYDKRPPVNGIDEVMAHFRTFQRMEKGLDEGNHAFHGEPELQVHSR